MIFKAAQLRISQLTVAFFILAVITAPQIALAAEVASVNRDSSSIYEVVADDYSSFYASERLLRMGLVLGAGAIMANTNTDMSIRNWYQDNVRSESTNSRSSVEGNNAAFRAKLFGEGKYMVPVALLAASVNYLDTDTALGNWARTQAQTGKHS